MPSMEDVKHLQIPLQDITLATNIFAKENLIGEGGFGPVYKGVSQKHGCIAVKRLVCRQKHGQGEHEFKMEIALLSKYEHENIVSLLGFCDEDDEKILVYRYESNGSLNKHLNNEALTWIQRLWICLDAARGLKYLHDNVSGIFHRDVKSPNILLDENWKAKISDFGLSRIRPANMQGSFLISNPCGTEGYIDPGYRTTGYLTQKSDVYSFGVVLWEVLCGRLAHVTLYNDDRRYLTNLVGKHYINEILDRIIPFYLHKQMNTDSLRTFSKIAYRCLKNREERPTMKEVVDQLQEAIDHQLEVKTPEEEAKPTVKDEKKGENSKDRAPSPPCQDIVLSTYMHCQRCAREVRKCLKGFEGVEDVFTDCETHKVVVKGAKADPLKVLEKVKKKSHRKVELLSPVPVLVAEELKELELEESSECKEKKNEEVKNLEGQKAVEESKVRRCLEDFAGVEGVVTDCETHMVIVKGQQAGPLKVQERVQKKCHRKVELISPVQKPLTNEPKKPKQEKPRKQVFITSFGRLVANWAGY